MGIPLRAFLYLSGTPPKIELTVPRTTQYLGMVRRVVAMAAERVGFSTEEVDMIELAIDEACSNAVLYACEEDGQLDIIVEITDQRFTIIMRDHGGERFDFESEGNFEVQDKLKSEKFGGLGIYIIKNFMDEVTYEYSPKYGNVILMVKLRPVSV